MASVMVWTNLGVTPLDSHPSDHIKQKIFLMTGNNFQSYERGQFLSPILTKIDFDLLLWLINGYVKDFKLMG